LIGNLGLTELIIILVLALVVFGAGKLPGVGKALGQSIREFKGAVTEPKTAGEEEKTEVVKDV